MVMNLSNEIIGITATIITLIGFMSNKEKVIRGFDLAGSMLFVIYGVTIGSVSTILLNSVLILVHAYKFYRGRIAE